MDFASALLCITLAIFKEAEGEGLEGMRAVGDVVINRVESDEFPDDVCGVVLQPKQFSWVNKIPDKTIGGLVDVQFETLNSPKMNKQRLNTYRDAEAVARYILSKDYNTKYKYKFFHSAPYKPYWAKKKRKHRIGRHNFME